MSQTAEAIGHQVKPYRRVRPGPLDVFVTGNFFPGSLSILGKNSIKKQRCVDAEEWFFSISI